ALPRKLKICVWDVKDGPRGSGRGRLDAHQQALLLLTTASARAIDRHLAGAGSVHDWLPADCRKILHSGSGGVAPRGKKFVKWIG
ncbi:MAG TPA: hypothetical protein PK440_20195, partial [Candidatus Accumulibacter phosphatis]|nr:hypothetical protein [Candidatus Accumulibacter phosphatis]